MAPLIVAHRGYRDKYPENTLSAFQGAADLGVDIIETDLQVTKDGFIVLSHDPETGRTFDKDLIINDTELLILKELKTKKQPEQRIISFDELLLWHQNGNDKIKLMLDIKPNNDVSILAKIIRSLLDTNKPLDYWYDKIIFGLWTPQFYDFIINTNLLSNFDIVNITISPTIAKIFLEKSFNLPNDSKVKIKGISLLNVSLLAPEFPSLKKLLKDKNIDLYVWTSNSSIFFENAISNNVLGIITDAPVQLQSFIEKVDNNSDLFKLPPLFTSARFQLGLRFYLFRLFEFIVLRNLFGLRPVRLVLRQLVKLLAS